MVVFHVYFELKIESIAIVTYKLFIGNHCQVECMR